MTVFGSLRPVRGRPPAHRKMSVSGPVGVLGAGAVIVVGVLLSAGLLPGQERRAPATLPAGATCLDKDCHAAMATGASVHRPVAKNTCDVCHEQADEKVHKFTLAQKGGELCNQCHEGMAAKKFVHAPLQDANRPCLSCHDPHSSTAKPLLKSGGGSALCLTCHAEMGGGDAVRATTRLGISSRLHASAAVKGCVRCHEPHSSSSSRLLRGEPPGLCFSCHEDIQTEGGLAKHMHGPVNVGCVSCHNPHLVLSEAGLKRPGAALCLTCHADFKPRFSALSQRHGRLLEGKQCLRCHQPHFSARDSLLADTPRTLCLGCHDDDVKSADGRAIPGLAAQLVQGAHLHGPLKQQNCAPCHQPHGNERASFLEDAYPAGFYAPFRVEAYALCFGCHDANLATQAQTADATGFRNGTASLHYVHVNKASKGRTCRACHLPHAGKNPHLLADAVPFGEWSIPIAFTASASGGSCAPGCHAPKAYDRLKPRLQQRAAPETAPASGPASAPASAPAPVEGGAIPTTSAPAGESPSR